VSSRRIRKGMRAAPGEDRPRTPTFHANPGVVASARSHGPDAPRVRSESPDPQSRQEAASLCREHILLVLSRILQREPGDRPDPGALQSARPDGAATAPSSARPDQPVDCAPFSSSARRSPAAHKQTECPDSDAGSRQRMCGRCDRAPATEKRSRKCSIPRGRRMHDPQFLFPQPSQHLPFPFHNTRVEVGRTVMED